MPSKPSNIDQYIAIFSPEVQAVLEKIRATIRKAAPTAEEKISYRMPAFTLDGRILIYFAAFKHHIGIYPPVRDERLQAALAPYRGEKGNLKFPLSQPIPYALISRIVKARAQER